MVASATNPIPTICAAKLYEVQKYMTLTNHQYNPQSVVVSKKFWDALSADEKKILRDTAQESAKYEREQVRASVSSMLESLKKSGMQVTQLPPAEVAKLREKMVPVIAKHSASVGNATVKAMMAELEKLRK